MLDTGPVSVIALIQLDFDPVLSLGDLSVPWQAVVVAIALVAGIVLAAQSRTRDARRRVVEADPLRLDDLAYILLAVVPGAVLGGRLVHGLAFWEFYRHDPWLLLDPAQGSLSLLGAVLGGALTGAWMCRLLAAPVRRWADTAALPLLLTLGLGKLSQLLGGSGQGAPFNGPWAVAFLGDGPWVSADPALPSHPAQAYEAIWLLLGALLLPGLLASLHSKPSRHGVLFVLALIVFLVGRVLVGFSWRDESVAGPLNAEQLMALAALVALALAMLAVTISWFWRGRRRSRRAAAEIVRMDRPPSA